jgi:hypothetical protein
MLPKEVVAAARAMPGWDEFMADLDRKEAERAAKRVKALLLDLAKAKSPKPGTMAFEKWCDKHPEFHGRVTAVLQGLAVDEAGELIAVTAAAKHSAGKEVVA